LSIEDFLNTLSKRLPVFLWYTKIFTKNENSSLLRLVLSAHTFHKPVRIILFGTFFTAGSFSDKHEIKMP
jgi:hypothetical protein